MKDPLQTEQTPYEILGVGPGATAAEVERAFMAALARRVPPNTAKNARDALVLHPVKRAWYDVRQYRDEVLRQLSPPALEQPGLLDRRSRAATAREWEARSIREMQTVGLVHTMAVLWYWWALYEEERMLALLSAAAGQGALPPDALSRQNVLRHLRRAEGVTCDPEHGQACTVDTCPWREDCLSSAPPLRDLWTPVIAYWCTLAACPGFWTQDMGLDAGTAEAVQQQVVAALKDTLLDLAGRYDGVLSGAPGADEGVDRIPGVRAATAGALRRAGLSSMRDVARAQVTTVSSAAGVDEQAAGRIVAAARQALGERLTLPDQYRLLERDLATELETAHLAHECGLQTKYGRISCGVLMLQRCRGVEMLRKVVDDVLVKRPDHKGYRRLRDMLSPHAPIATLLEQRKPDAALEAIGRLPAAERRTDEVKALQARAYHLLARQRVSLGQVEAALDAWKSALAAAKDSALRAEIEAELVEAVHQRAAALQQARRDEAIALLEKGLAVVASDRLQMTVAELLTRRGVDVFVSAQRKLERERTGVTREILDAFQKGLADLERAEQLGSRDAARQAAAARQVLEQVKSGFLDVPEDVRKLLAQARDATDAGRLDQAITCLRQVRSRLGARTPEAVLKNLAMVLNARAVDRANEAHALLERAPRRVFEEAVKGTGF